MEFGRKEAAIHRTYSDRFSKKDPFLTGKKEILTSVLEFDPEDLEKIEFTKRQNKNIKCNYSQNLPSEFGSKIKKQGLFSLEVIYRFETVNYFDE